MDGQKGEHTGISSSIVLLQERFRQLEQVRERREGKQLQKQVLESETTAPLQYLELGKAPFQHPVRTARSRIDDSLSNRLNDNRNHHAGLQNVEGQTSSKVWSSEPAAANDSDKLEYSDVDTSLRL